MCKRALLVMQTSEGLNTNFADEIDAIAAKREHAQRDMERRLVAQMLTCMDDLASRSSAPPLGTRVETAEPGALHNDPSSSLGTAAPAGVSSAAAGAGPAQLQPYRHVVVIGKA